MAIELYLMIVDRDDRYFKCPNRGRIPLYCP